MTLLKIFNGFMSTRWRSNAIILFRFMLMGYKWKVRMVLGGEVYNPFTTHFQTCNNDRSGVENLNFNYLNRVHCGELIKLFSLEEVKQTG